MPIAMHSLIGIAIGFLLVFRANTSYDRWFEGRKRITEMSGAVNMFTLKLRACIKAGKDEDMTDVKKMLVSFLKNFQSYLKTEDSEECEKFKENESRLIYEIMSKLKSLEVSGRIKQGDLTMLEKFLAEFVSAATTCERIKDTPIPVSYALHIKVSIFIYILSLPFGLFYDLKLWSSAMVMVVFYIMYGIELISSEIENPFHGDPNDLPLDDFTNKTVAMIERNLDRKSKEIPEITFS
jgi:putative membrane protein